MFNLNRCRTSDTLLVLNFDILNRNLLPKINISYEPNQLTLVGIICFFKTIVIDLTIYKYLTDNLHIFTFSKSYD